MGFTISIAVVGILVVFLSLIILAVVISVFGMIFYSKKNTPKDGSATAMNKAPILETNGDEKLDAPYNNLSNEELVAVLTAAVQASFGRTPECRIRVKSFRRIPQTSPAWNLMGRSEYFFGKL
ncbi:MAG: OadG family protein [Acetivibrionales bacterium]|jgi:sodium pump decarboxylase gamma subunit